MRKDQHLLLAIISCIFALPLICCADGISDGYSFKTYDVPNTPNMTVTLTSIYGASGSTIYGSFYGLNSIESGFYGFVDTNGAITMIDPADYQNLPGYYPIEAVTGVSGSTWVGTLGYSGVIYNQGVGSRLNAPNAAQVSRFTGMDGSTAVGYGVDQFGTYFCFTETNGTFTTFDVPMASNEQVASGISGNTIVGWYSGFDYTQHGFLDVSGTFTQFDVPGAVWTTVLGISGSTVFGNSSLGFFTDKDGAITLSNINDPDADPGSTYISGMMGQNIVGSYITAGIEHGFIASPVPEPSGLGLFAAVGSYPLLRRPRKSKSA